MKQPKKIFGSANNPYAFKLNYASSRKACAFSYFIPFFFSFMVLSIIFSVYHTAKQYETIYCRLLIRSSKKKRDKKPKEVDVLVHEAHLKPIVGLFRS